MRTIHFIIIVTAFALALCGIVIGAPVSKTDKVTQYFAGNEGPRPAYYRIENRAFSEVDAMAKLGFLKKHGFDWTENAKEGEEVSYKDPIKRQWLAYNPKQSRYIYYNNISAGLTDSIVDINQLRSKADECVSDFLGNEANTFKYKNSELEYQAIRGTPRRLVSVTFRYVRVLDDREILGLTNHLRITLTHDGTLKFLDYTNPVIVKTQEISSKIKRKSFNKYLDLYLNSDAFMKSINGDPLPIKSITVSDASSSYFAEKIGEKVYLSPHTSFRSLIVTDNGTTKREFHMKDDPEMVASIQDEDIVHYILHTK